MPDPSGPPTFATFFDSLLSGLGMTNAEAARKLRVAESAVGRWRKGQGGVRLQYLERIHDVFGTDLSYMRQLAGYSDNSSASTAAEDPEVSALLEADRQAIREEFSGIPPVFWKPIIDARRTAGQLAVDNVKAALRIAREHLPFSDSSALPISNDPQDGEPGASGDESAKKKPFTRHYPIRNAKQHFANTSAALAL